MQNFRKPQVVPGPVFDLAAFQRQVQTGDFHPYATSALDEVIVVYKCTRSVARRIVQTIVCTLGTRDYVRSIRLDDGQLADEYGKMFDDRGWYVKLLINRDDGEHDVVSCNLTKCPLTTQSETIAAFGHKVGGSMDVVSAGPRAPKRCASCGKGVFMNADVKGRTFAYRDELELEIQESLTMQVCNVCGEIRESATDTVALDMALARGYAVRHRAMTVEAVARLTGTGWRQVDIEQAMGLSTGYLSKALRGDKALSGPTLRHLIHLSRHPRVVLQDLAPLYANIKQLEAALEERGALTAA